MLEQGLQRICQNLAKSRSCRDRIPELNLADNPCCSATYSSGFEAVPIRLIQLHDPLLFAHDASSTVLHILQARSSSRYVPSGRSHLESTEDMQGKP